MTVGATATQLSSLPNPVTTGSSTIGGTGNSRSSVPASMSMTPSLRNGRGGSRGSGFCARGPGGKGGGCGGTVACISINSRAATPLRN